MTIELLEATCRFWQATLRLQDWDVVIRYARAHEIPGIGQVQICGTKRLATILVIDPVDVPSRCADAVRPDDAETIIVHELLHIHLWDACPKHLPETDPMEIAAERAIDALARAYVALRRGGEKDADAEVS